MKLNTYNLTAAGSLTFQDPSEMVPDWFIDDQVRWVDVMTSSTDEIERLLGPLDLHEKVRAEWESPAPRPEVVILEDLLFVRLPYLSASGELHTLRLLVGPTAIVSARTAAVEELDQLVTTLETGARKVRPTVAHLLIELLEAILREASPASYKLRDEIHDLADGLEAGAKDIALSDLLGVKRRSTELVSLIEDQLICLGHLMVVRSDSLSLSKVKSDLNTVIKALQRIRPIVLRLNDEARELRHGYAGLLQEASNRRLSLLAVLSAIYLPSTLVAGIFGMNFSDIPMTEVPGGYVVALLLIVVLVVSQLLFFWRRGWFE